MSLTDEHQSKTEGKRPLWVRLVSISVIWTALTLVVAGVLLSLVFRDTLERNFDQRLSSLLDNLIGVSSNVSATEIDLERPMSDPRFDQPYSGWYWQISAEGMVPYRSRSLWDVDLEVNYEAEVGSVNYSYTNGPEEQQLRILERTITIPESDIVYHFSVAVDTSEIEEQAVRFDNILLVGLSVLGVGLIAASLLQVFLGLKPLGHIKQSLSEVRTGEAEYLPTDFPKEIQPLADELNALLDHNNEIVVRSRTQVGNLAHALKTPIAVLRNEARMNDGPMSSTVAKQTEDMHKYVEHYLRRARVSANTKSLSGHSAVVPALHNIARALNKIHAGKNVTVIANDPNLIFKGDVNDFEEMAGNLMENAAKWASKLVTVECFREDDWLLIEIRDDGPGIEKSAREDVFARGERLDEKKPGSGLGLSIVKDLSGLYGGEINLADNDRIATSRGLLVTLKLPIV